MIWKKKSFTTNSISFCGRQNLALGPTHGSTFTLLMDPGSSSKMKGWLEAQSIQVISSRWKFDQVQQLFDSDNYTIRVWLGYCYQIPHNLSVIRGILILNQPRNHPTAMLSIRLSFLDSFRVSPAYLRTETLPKSTFRPPENFHLFHSVQSFFVPYSHTSQSYNYIQTPRSCYWIIGSKLYSHKHSTRALQFDTYIFFHFIQ